MEDFTDLLATKLRNMLLVYINMFIDIQRAYLSDSLNNRIVKLFLKFYHFYASLHLQWQDCEKRIFYFANVTCSILDSCKERKLVLLGSKEWSQFVISQRHWINFIIVITMKLEKCNAHIELCIRKHLIIKKGLFIDFCGVHTCKHCKYIIIVSIYSFASH